MRIRVNSKEKEEAVTYLFTRLCLTGLGAGTVVGAYAAFRFTAADSITATAARFFWVLAIALPLTLLAATVNKWLAWSNMRRVDTSEALGLLIGTAILGTLVASGIYLVPSVSFPYLFRGMESESLKASLLAAFNWRDLGLVVVTTTVTAGLQAVRLYRSNG